MSVRIEKRVEVGGASDVIRIVSTEIPDFADDFAVAAAAVKVEDAADKLARLSTCCLVPWGAVHASHCPYIAGRDGWIEELRAEAIKEGMRP